MVIIDSYLDYHHKYSKIYEQNTLVLMQVGSFFEVYATLEEGPPIQSIGEILEIQVTKKNKSITTIDKSNHLLLGFPIHSVKKFIDILLSNNFTIILIEQTTPPPNPKREVTQIISPSTYTENTSLSTNNYLMTIYFSVGHDKNKNEFILSSISWVDITTNESFIYETNDTDSIINIEDTLKTISNNSPSEIVCFTDIQTKSNTKLMNMLSNFIKSIPSNICIHNKLSTLINDNFFKLSYQNTIFKKVFKNTNTILSIIEYLDLEMKPLSVVSFAYLLQFVYEHSDKIINGIKKPIFLENHKYLSLINNALENLNIVSNKTSNTKTSSLINLLNNCKTSIGKRFFKQCLINPLTDPNKINERYEQCDMFIKNDLYKEVRIHLSKISDIERLYKRIILGTLQPSEFVSIHNSLEALTILCKYNFKNMNWTTDNQSCLEDFMIYYKKKFDLSEMEKVNLIQINKNIFNKGIHPELDSMGDDISCLENIFENVLSCLNEGKSIENSSNEFKLEKNKDNIKSITITLNRFSNLKKDKSRCNYINKLLSKCSLSLDDIIEKPVSTNNKTNLKISFKGMNDSQSKLSELQSEFKSRITELYLHELKHFYENYESLFIYISHFVGLVDFYSTNAKNSVDFCYTRPNIVYESKDSFIDTVGIRHPLIEQIQVDIPYISNDVSIGSESMILYGLNSSGKSSLMKSIGMNLIMAQTGMFTACKSFNFHPYNHIFSRVIGGDNLFKGQSSFVSEINEIRTILKRTDNHSLVLGDELLNSTETTSAIAMIVSGINILSRKNTSFIFASHLHELCDIDSIKNLSNVNIYHLSVDYDNEKNILIYNRKLKPGNGNSLYVLEVAYSLDMPQEFLSFAHSVRDEFLNRNKFIVEPRISKYNKDVYMDICSVCDKKCEEVHHLNPQEKANDHGFIKNKQLHMNHKSNLLPICIECHDNIHNGNINVCEPVLTSKGVELIVEHNLKPDLNLIELRVRELRNNGNTLSNILNIVNNEFQVEKITMYKIKKWLK